MTLPDARDAASVNIISESQLGQEKPLHGRDEEAQDHHGIEGFRAEKHVNVSRMTGEVLPSTRGGTVCASVVNE